MHQTKSIIKMLENYEKNLDRVSILKTQKELSFRILITRLEKLKRPCLRLIYHGSLRYWSILSDLITLIIFDGKFVKENITRFFEYEGIKSFCEYLGQYNISSSWMEFVLKTSIIERKIFEYYFYDFISQPDYSTLEKLVDLSIEMANIRFWQISGCQFNCQIFNKEKCLLYSDICEIKNPCLRIYVFYEQFLLETNPYEEYPNVIKEYFKNIPDNFQVIFDFYFIKKRVREGDENVKEKINHIISCVKETASKMKNLVPEVKFENIEIGESVGSL